MQRSVAESLRIRRARLDDAELLLEIQREAAVTAFAHVFPQDRYPFPDEEVRAGWRAALSDPGIEVYLGEWDGTPAGSVSIGDEYLRTLYVLPAYHGRGVGSALHDLALERLQARGIARAKLWTLEENHEARRFYERRGWTLTDETRVVRFPPNPIDVQYAKELTLRARR